MSASLAEPHCLGTRCSNPRALIRLPIAADRPSRLRVGAATAVQGATGDDEAAGRAGCIASGRDHEAAGIPCGAAPKGAKYRT